MTHLFRHPPACLLLLSLVSGLVACGGGGGGSNPTPDNRRICNVGEDISSDCREARAGESRPDPLRICNVGEDISADCREADTSTGETRPLPPSMDGLLRKHEAPTAPKLNFMEAADFEAQKTSFETPEYDGTFRTIPVNPATILTNRHLRRINASAAYARGATGAGETVVVFDSGFYSNHIEFRNADGSDKLVAPYTGRQRPHGTAVASVAAGTKTSNTVMHGVAFEAQLHLFQLPRVSTPAPGGPYVPIALDTYDEFSGAPRDAEDAATFGSAIREGLGAIVNHSFGLSGGIDFFDLALVRAKLPLTAAAFAQAEVPDADKKILVWAAGNAHCPDAARGCRRLPDGSAPRSTSPEILSGLGVAFPELQSHVLAVVALDQDGGIASYSNRCGNARSFCLAAPGTSIISAGFNNQGNPPPDLLTIYTAPSGTSFAAPIVSGSLALLRHYFRNPDNSYQLGNTELVRRLLATANKEGIYADAEIYGQGLVDLDAATAPVGSLMTGMLGAADSRPLADSRVALSGQAYGASLQSRLAALPIVGFDALDAPFAPANAAWITRPTRQAGGRAGLHAPTRATARMSLRSPQLSLTLDHDGGIYDARLTAKDWWFAYRQHGGQALGLAAQPLAQLGGQTAAAHFSDALAFSAPYLSWVRDGAGFGWARALGGGRRLGFALTHGSAWFAEQPEVGGKRGLGALFEYRLRPDWSLQAGVLREADGFLGARPSGAFGTARSATAFVGFNRAWAVRRQPRWRMLASAYLGHTRPQIERAGFLYGASDIFSSAFSLGAARASMWRADDWFGVRLSQPLRTERGSAKLRVAVGRDKNRQVLYQDYEVDLTPSGRNLQAELAYRVPLAGGAIKANLGVQHHPQHQRTDNLQSFMRLSFERSF